MFVFSVLIFKICIFADFEDGVLMAEYDGVDCQFVINVTSIENCAEDPRKPCKGVLISIYTTKYIDCLFYSKLELFYK